MIASTSRSRALLVLVIALSAFGARNAKADDGAGIPVPASANAPAAPKSAALEAGTKAVTTARAELAAAESRFAKETEELNQKIVAETDAILALAAEEQSLRGRLDEIRRELEVTEEKIASLGFERDRTRRVLNDQLKDLRSEITSQALGLRQRFKDTHHAALHPEFLRDITAFLDNDRMTLDERIAALLALLERGVKLAYTVERTRAPVRIDGLRAPPETCDILTLGSLGGYFVGASDGDAGYLLPALDSTSTLAGRAAGLEEEQRALVAAFVAGPERGGLLPIDVAGGSGFRAQAREAGEPSVFARYGFILWPLLSLGAVGLFLTIAFGHRLRKTTPQPASRRTGKAT